MIKIARTVCLEACNHQRQVLARRRPFRAISLRASRPAPVYSSTNHKKVIRATGKVPVLKAGIRSRGFACSAAVMEEQSATGNPLLAVWVLHLHQIISPALKECAGLINHAGPESDLTRHFCIRHTLALRTLIAECRFCANYLVCSSIALGASLFISIRPIEAVLCRTLPSLSLMR